jgi:periplasmic mercuric ion binding protein
MKSVKSFSIVILLTIFSLNLPAQTDDVSKTAGSKTESFKVFGNCEMCKTRIEKTAMSENTIAALWDSKTKMLSVTFDPKKTSVDAISKKIALAGHDTEKYKATDEVYTRLPGCCHYERSK